MLKGNLVTKCPLGRSLSMRLLLPLLAALALLPATATTAAAAPQDLGPLARIVGPYGAGGLVGTDDSGSVVVLRPRTGVRRTYAVPAGCYAGRITGHRLLLSCPGDPSADVLARGSELDLRTGSTTPLPDIDRERAGSADQISYFGVGQYWASLYVSGYHYATETYVNRVTGAGAAGPYERNRVADLDYADLSRRLCSPLRRPLVIDDVDPTGGYEPGELAVVNRTAASVSDDDTSQSLLLQRCGRRTRTIRRGGDVDRRVLAYDDRTLIWEEHERKQRGAHTTLLIRDIRTGRTQRYRDRATEPLRLIAHRLYTIRGGRLLRLPLP